MREVDFWSHFMLGGGLLVVLAGGLLAGMGIFSVLAVAGVILYSGTTHIAALIGCTASSALICMIPGLILSSPGLMLVAAILWGRLRSRWSHIKWKEFRDEDVVAERDRLDRLDRERQGRGERAEEQRRRTLGAVAREGRP